MFLDPLGDFGKVLVLLPDVVLFAEVDEVDDGLGGEEEEGVDDFDLVISLAMGHRSCIVLCASVFVVVSDGTFSHAPLR